MTKLPGITFETTSKGTIKKVTFDMKQHADFLEDYLDGLRAKEILKNGEFVPFAETLKKHEALKKKGKCVMS